jgi:hypothetical protein
VKPTVIKNIPSWVGQAAYQMKPKIAAMTWYVKVAVDDPGTSQEQMAMLSAHVDH